MELLQRMGPGGNAHQAAVDRVRSLADLMNGLISSCTAVGLAVLTAAGIFISTVVLGRESADDSRSILMLLFFVVSGFWMLLLWQAERRVAHVTEAFVIGMIRGDWSRK